jgi:tRNA(Ile)-lysidine synthase
MRPSLLINAEVAKAMAKARARCAVEAQLLKFLSRRGFAPEDRLAVAYSGGPDSTALLLALSALGWRRITAIYVDHALRPREELDAEHAIVKGLCAELGIRLIVARLRPGAVRRMAEERGEGIEAAARRFRRAALKSAAGRVGTKAILLAHTRDDQVETTLMRLLGGSGAGGLRGMPEVSGPFMRPFLVLAKRELLAYLGERQRSYSVDSTNSSAKFLRNRLRNELMPFLDASFPGWRKGMSRASEKAALDEEALGAEAEALEFTERGDGSLHCPAAPFFSAPDAVALRALVRAVGRTTRAERIPWDMAIEAMRALKSGREAAFRGRGIALRLSGDRIVLSLEGPDKWRRGLDFPRRDGYFVSVDRPCQIRVGRLELRAEWRDSTRLPDGGSGIRDDAFSFPLIVRSRRPGDAISLKGGTKRLDELFSEWGLAERSRGKLPIVEDRDGIVAVLGGRVGGKDRYRARREDSGPMAESSGGSVRLLWIIVKGA